MSLVEHLTELRRRVILVVVVFVVFGVGSFVFYPQILHALQAPYCRVSRSCKFFITTPLGGLSIRVNVAMYGGAILASPVALWEAWRFVTPGLKANERRYAALFVSSAILLFAGGAAVAYLTFPHAMGFLNAIGGSSIRQIYSPSSYVNLILALMAIFGVSFEFPVVLVGLQLAGIVSPKTLGKWRRLAAFLIVALAAVITPSGDPFSMFALAVPMYVFYELSIWLAKLILHRREVRASAAPEPAAATEGGAAG